MAMTDEEIINKLSQSPELLKRVGRLLEIVENKEGRTTLADDAEECVIEEMRELGKEVMEKWAQDEAQRREHMILESGVAVRKKVKKNSTGIQHMGSSV